MLQLTSSKLCCADWRKGDMAFLPFLSKKKLEKNFLPKYKQIWSQIEVFSQICGNFSKKTTIYSPFFVKNAYFRSCFKVPCNTPDKP